MKFIFSIRLFFAFLLLFSCKNEEIEQSNEEVDPYFTLLTEINSDISESSGLAYFGGELWTLNDSGDGPFLYQITDDSSTILRTITLENSTNVDWEDLAHNPTHLFVGDFGNNRGNREDLLIYSILKSAIDNQETVPTKVISFNYPDQSKFDYENHQHNFDCESLIAVGEELFLFSKNFIDKKTRLYQLDTVPGDYTANLIDSFNVAGTLSGAAISSDAKLLALLGYNFTSAPKNYTPFVWLFWNYPNTDFFNGQSQKVELEGDLQTEGIAYFEDFKFIVSTENEGGREAELYLFDATQWIE